MLWVHMEVDAEFSWPNRLVEFPFEGHRVVLGPRTDTLACSANLYVAAGTTFKVGGSSLSRFLSVLAWSQDNSIVDRLAIGSNHPAVPTRVAHGGRQTSHWTAVDPWWVIYLPTIDDPRAALALALYREGMGVRSAPLACTRPEGLKRPGSTPTRAESDTVALSIVSPNFGNITRIWGSICGSRAGVLLPTPTRHQ